jgi:prepilin-type processing-associated H-X9-DG protein
MEQTKIDELIAAADKRAVYINQVEHAKAKFRSLNVLYWDGHIFELNQGFLSYLYIKYMEWLSTRERQAQGKPIDIPLEPVILLDKNEEPVQIDDLNKFVEEVEECHTEALNYYNDTYIALKLSRTTSELIEVG